MELSLEVKYGRDKFWREWIRKIPEIQFPAHWKIQIIPPFAGALIRFRVNNKISVYLDVDGSLGYWVDENNKPAPYWEIHPYDDDVWRIDMEKVDELLEAIQKSLDEYVE